MDGKYVNVMVINFYLGTSSETNEYMCIPLEVFPEQMFQQ